MTTVTSDIPAPIPLPDAAAAPVATPPVAQPLRQRTEDGITITEYDAGNAPRLADVLPAASGRGAVRRNYDTESWGTLMDVPAEMRSAFAAGWNDYAKGIPFSADYEKFGGDQQLSYEVGRLHAANSSRIEPVRPFHWGDPHAVRLINDLLFEAHRRIGGAVPSDVAAA